MGDKTLQESGHSDTPSKKGTRAGDNGRQGKTTPREGRHTFQKREEDKLGDKLGEKLGDKEGKASDTPSNKGTRVRRQWETIRDRATQGETRPWTHQPTRAHMRQWETVGDNGRQWETREGKALGRRTRNPTHVVRQWETRGDKTSGRRTHHPTQAMGEKLGDKGRKGLGKADTPSNKEKQEGAQWETKETIGKADSPSNRGKPE